VNEGCSLLQAAIGNIDTLMKHEELARVPLVTCRGFDATTGKYRSWVLVRAVLIEVKLS
jgi:hypothetical protein